MGRLSGADREFERYQDAYPDLASLRMTALRGSLNQHRRAGEEFFEERAYGPAWREFTAASARQPSDSALAERVRSAWAEHSRQVAEETRAAAGRSMRFRPKRSIGPSTRPLDPGRRTSSATRRRAC